MLWLLEQAAYGEGFTASHFGVRASRDHCVTVSETTVSPERIAEVYCFTRAGLGQSGMSPALQRGKFPMVGRGSPYCRGATIADYAG